MPEVFYLAIFWYCTCKEYKDEMQYQLSRVLFPIFQAKGGKSLDPSDTCSLSGSLQQAKEILRLARTMKAEAEQMKEEAYRELELARRERHDASLLKKNAAEILKIAKRKLASK